MIQQENFITSFVRIINITSNVGPCQISPQHGKQTPTTTHRPQFSFSTFFADFFFLISFLALICLSVEPGVPDDDDDDEC